MASSNEMAKHSDETPSCEPLINSVKLKLPTKPTVAARLYFDYRWEELKALGKSGEEIYKICHSEYQMMADEHKLKWIRLAVEKTPSHLVLFSALYCVFPIFLMILLIVTIFSSANL